MTVLALHEIHKHFRQGGRAIPVLQGARLIIEAGEMVALVGPSGCGKTTLLQIAGLLDRPDSGEIWLKGVEVSRLPEAVHTGLRNHQMGFVYQFHHLLPELSALENVMLPQLIRGTAERLARAAALELLAELGMEERMHHRPAQLSGGQMQRVAIARALVNQPALLMADEPTGNLDPATAERVMDLFVSTVRERGTALLMVTHNERLAARMDRQVTLEQGRVVTLE